MSDRKILKELGKQDDDEEDDDDLPPSVMNRRRTDSPPAVERRNFTSPPRSNTRKRKSPNRTSKRADDDESQFSDDDDEDDEEDDEDDPKGGRRPPSSKRKLSFEEIDEGDNTSDLPPSRKKPPSKNVPQYVDEMRGFPVETLEKRLRAAVADDGLTVDQRRSELDQIQRETKKEIYELDSDEEDFRLVDTEETKVKRERLEKLSSSTSVAKREVDEFAREFGGATSTTTTTTTKRRVPFLPPPVAPTGTSLAEHLRKTGNLSLRVDDMSSSSSISSSSSSEDGTTQEEVRVFDADEVQVVGAYGDDEDEDEADEEEYPSFTEGHEFIGQRAVRFLARGNVQVPIWGTIVSWSPSDDEETLFRLRHEDGDEEDLEEDEAREAIAECEKLKEKGIESLEDADEEEEEEDEEDDPNAESFVDDGLERDGWVVKNDVEEDEGYQNEFEEDLYKELKKIGKEIQEVFDDNDISEEKKQRKLRALLARLKQQDKAINEYIGDEMAQFDEEQERKTKLAIERKKITDKEEKKRFDQENRRPPVTYERYTKFVEHQRVDLWDMMNTINAFIHHVGFDDLATATRHSYDYVRPNFATPYARRTLAEARARRRAAESTTARLSSNQLAERDKRDFKPHENEVKKRKKATKDAERKRKKREQERKRRLEEAGLDDDDLDDPKGKRKEKRQDEEDEED